MLHSGLLGTGHGSKTPAKSTNNQGSAADIQHSQDDRTGRQLDKNKFQDLYHRYERPARNETRNGQNLPHERKQTTGESSNNKASESGKHNDDSDSGSDEFRYQLVVERSQSTDAERGTESKSETEAETEGSHDRVRDNESHPIGLHSDHFKTLTKEYESASTELSQDLSAEEEQKSSEKNTQMLEPTKLVSVEDSLSNRATGELADVSIESVHSDSQKLSGSEQKGNAGMLTASDSSAGVDEPGLAAMSIAKHSTADDSQTLSGVDSDISEATEQVIPGEKLTKTGNQTSELTDSEDTLEEIEYSVLEKTDPGFGDSVKSNSEESDSEPQKYFSTQLKDNAKNPDVELTQETSETESDADLLQPAMGELAQAGNPGSPKPANAVGQAVSSEQLGSNQNSASLLSDGDSLKSDRIMRHEANIERAAGQAVTIDVVPEDGELHQSSESRQISTPRTESQIQTKLVEIPIRQPITDPQWHKAMGDRLMMMMSRHLQVATIRLDPPDMGFLEVKITVGQDQQTQVSFVSGHLQVREALEAASPRLRQMMEEQGLNLINVDISDRKEPDGGEANDKDGRGSNAQGGIAVSEHEDDELFSSAAMGLVDHYV